MTFLCRISEKWKSMLNIIVRRLSTEYFFIPALKRQASILDSRRHFQDVNRDFQFNEEGNRYVIASFACQTWTAGNEFWEYFMTFVSRLQWQFSAERAYEWVGLVRACFTVVILFPFKDNELIRLAVYFQTFKQELDLLWKKIFVRRVENHFK